MSRPALIDTRALHRHRMRAASVASARKHAESDFLLRAVADDIALRLSAVTRRFPLAVDLNGAGDAVCEAMRRSGKCDVIVRSRALAFAEKDELSLIAPDDTLPFANGAIDLAVSALVLQFVEDIPGVLAQVRRALRPDGLFVAALAGGATLRELRRSFLAAEAEVEGSARARVLPFLDVREAGDLLQRAGFALAVADSDTLVVRYDTVFDLMRDLRSMGAANCLADRQKTFLRRDVMMRMAEIYARDFSDPDGRIRATFEIVSLSGWAPHESQQKPLKPGSAEISLAHILGRDG